MMRACFTPVHEPERLAYLFSLIGRLRFLWHWDRSGKCFCKRAGPWCNYGAIPRDLSCKLGGKSPPCYLPKSRHKHHPRRTLHPCGEPWLAIDPPAICYISSQGFASRRPPCRPALTLMSLDDFGFDFGHYSSSAVPPFSEGIGHSQPLHPNLAQNYPPAGGQPPAAYGAQSSAQGKKATNASKRTASRQISLEEQSRIAAEEDKRRRNTAASARFRVKKKIREQALEKREKELSDEVSALNKRIMQLETENKFLKNLVVEKTGTKESKFDAKLTEALEDLRRSAEAGDTSGKTKPAEHERAALVA